MNLTLSELRCIAEELRETLSSGLVREIRSPEPGVLVLTVWVDSQERYLLADVRMGSGRVHLVARRTATRSPPTAFTMLLRKHLVGLPVRDVVLPWKDRVVAVDVGIEEVEFRLLVELSGHHPNAFLLKASGEIVGFMAIPRSHQRELLAGGRYVPPPLPEFRVVDGVPSADSSAREVLVTSHELEARYEEELAASSLHRSIASASRQVRKALARLQATLTALEGDLERCSEALQWQEKASALRGSLHDVVVAGGSASVWDFSQDPPARVEVPLAEGKGPVESMEEYFRRYRKGKRGKEKVLVRRAEVASRRDACLLLLSELERVASREDWQKFRLAHPSIGSDPGPGRNRPERQRRLPYREYLSGTGRRILVGRGGRDNHALTFQTASPRDVWMHVRGFPGSHVVVPLASGQQLDPTTLLEAAHLAVQHSQAPKEGYCEVMWTERKHVRAIRGGKPGQVQVVRERTFAFSFQPQVLPRAVVDSPGV